MNITTYPEQRVHPLGGTAGRGEVVSGFVLPSLNLMVLEIAVVKWQRRKLSSSPVKPSGEKLRWEISAIKGSILESVGLWKQ